MQDGPSASAAAPQGEGRVTPRHSLVVLGLCALSYLYVFPYQAPINNPNENVRLYMTAAIVEHGTYAINDIRQRWGWVNDAGVRDGRFYSVKAPGTSLLGVPAYAAYYGFTRATGQPVDKTIAIWCVRVSASVLPTLVWLFFLQRFIARHTRSAVLRDATVFSVALGSLLYGYGLLFVSHTLSAVCAFGSLMVFAGPGPLTARRIVWGGVLAAAVTLFEYPGLIASVVLAAWAAWQVGPRRLHWLALGGAIPTLLMMHFQYFAFGNPLTPGHRFLENKAYRALSEEGFFGAGAFQPEAAVALLTDSGFGLLPLTPVLWLAPVGFVLMLRPGARRPLGIVSLLITLLTVFAIALMNNWRGGWTIGPRYLAAVVPFCALGAMFALDALRGRARGLAEGAAIGALATALVLSGAPSAYYPHLPEAIKRPVPDLILPLIQFDFAPYNLGQWLGMSGSLSMLPLGLVAIAALAWLGYLAWASNGAWRHAIATTAAAIAACAITIAPGFSAAEDGRGARGALGFITERWKPVGQDQLSQLKALPENERPPNWEAEVAHLHRQLGQDRALRKWQRARRLRKVRTPR